MIDPHCRRTPGSASKGRTSPTRRPLDAFEIVASERNRGENWIGAARSLWAGPLRAASRSLLRIVGPSRGGNESGCGALSDRPARRAVPIDSSRGSKGPGINVSAAPRKILLLGAGRVGLHTNSLLSGAVARRRLIDDANPKRQNPSVAAAMPARADSFEESADGAR